MNKTYRLIWSELTCTWIAVAEIAKARGKKSSRALLLSAVLAAVLPAPTFAQAPPPNTLPTGGQVVAGQASIAPPVNNTLTINQSSQRAAIDWATFNVGSQARVNFIQPSSSAVALNRVLDPNPSQIFGRLTANGQVFLTNPSGIYFAPGASVNVGALVATTHRISNEDFMAGNYKFTRNGATGSVINEGEITADLGGYIALLAPEVRNTGVIVAQAGTVALAAGEAFELQFSSGSLANVEVEPAAIRALVENGHAVQAPGGLIILSAHAANRLQGGVVRNTGSLEATGLVNDGGTIRLLASDRVEHRGTINVDAALGKVGAGGTALLITDLANKDGVTEINGSISARGGEFGGNGGFVETSGGKVQLGADKFIDTRAPQGKTGQWLLDPTNWTIATSGGDETGISVSNSLLTADRTISVTNDINVNDTVRWTKNLLTLTAGNDININAVMTAGDFGPGSHASLALNTGANGHVNVGMTPDGLGFTGRLDFVANDGVTLRTTAGALTINDTAYTLVTTAAALQAIKDGDLAGHYALAGDINASATSGWNSGAGFTPIGSYGGSSPFTGAFNGLGHTISGLTISKAGNTNDGTGLFGMVQNGHISNVGLAGASVGGGGYVGGLVGLLMGLNGSAEVRNSFATGSVTGAYYSGGLIGLQGQPWGQRGYVTAPSVTMVSSSHFSGSVSGGSYIGGLVGAQYGFQDRGNSVDRVITGIENSSSRGTVVATASTAGGLVGAGATWNSTIFIRNSHSDSDVSAAQASFGGLVGIFSAYPGEAEISNSYATGKVTGTSNGATGVGGLIGTIDAASDWAPNDITANIHVDYSFATGAVSGTAYIGGLVGQALVGSDDPLNQIAIDNSYATGSVSATNDRAGGLVGFVYGKNHASIRNSYALGNVSGRAMVGGLIGRAWFGSLDAVYATGNVTGTIAAGSDAMVGGLVGEGVVITINNAFATGNAVATGNRVGGLVGLNAGNLTNVFSRGNASGGNDVGKLVGFQDEGSIDNYFATGSSPADLIGTLVSNPAIGTNVDPNALGTSTRTYLGGDPGLTGSWQSGTKPTLFDKVTVSGPVSGNLIAWDITNNSGTIALKDGTANQAVNSLTIAKAGTGSDAVNLGTAALNFDPSGYLHLTSGKLNLPSAPTLTMGAATYTVINKLGAAGSATGTDLQGLTINDSTVKYVLGLDIDATATATWNSNGSGGFYGFAPIGAYSPPFKGSFDGLGHAVHHLKINRPSTEFIGLFGGTLDASLANLGVANVDINGSNTVGALVGIQMDTVVRNSYATGRVSGSSGSSRIGGLVGYTYGNIGAASIIDSHAAVTVVGNYKTGGLVGHSYGGNGGTSIERSYATGRVTGGDYTGGLIGYNETNGGGSSITDSYATGAVSGSNYVGGLVGQNYGHGGTASITDSYATGAVSGSNNHVGGLVGRNYAYNEGTASITNSYATGAVTGDAENVGGLVGLNYGDGGTASISGSHATGAVTGVGSDGSYVGGLVGYNHSASEESWLSASITNSYATGAVTGFRYVGGLVGQNDGAYGSSATIVNSFATGVVTGTSSSSSDVGGLVGQNIGYDIGIASINNSYATGAINGSGRNFGGLVGYNYGNGGIARITNSYATGAVIASGSGTSFGGLVGAMWGPDATITDAYATGKVTGPSSVGGLIGSSFGESTITRAYALGLVTSGDATTAGGIIGSVLSTDAFTATFFDSTVNAGLPGAGNGVTAGITGKTTAELGDIATFQAAGWNIAVNSSLVTSQAPKLGWSVNGATTTWAIAGPSVIDLAFTLSPLGGTYTYKGSNYVLGDLWSSNAIFGSSYSSWVLGTDYTFQYGGNTVTGFATAATYSNIGISILKSGYQVAGAGNTTGSLTISRANATVTGNSASVIYTGQVQTISGYTVSGLVNNETASVLSSPTANGATGTNAGSYANTVSGNANDGNYNLTFRDGTLTIDKAHLTVTADNQRRLYGQANPAFTQTISGYVNGEDATSAGLTGSASGSNAATTNTGVGSYAITGSTGTLSAANYDFTATNGTLTIDRRLVTVTAEAKNKSEGMSDPAFTYQVEVESGSRGLVTGENLRGALTRVTGETPNAYAILQGTIDNTTNGNYAIDYVGADMTIVAVPLPPPPPSVPVTPLPTPDSNPPSVGLPLSDTNFGTTPPAPTFAPQSVGNDGTGAPRTTSDGVSVSLMREPSVQQAGIIAVSVPREMATAGAGFTFPVPAQVAEAAGNQQISASLVDGSPLPGWLSFNAETKTFIARAVPDSALPVQVVITIGSARVTIVISERAE